MTAAQRAAFTAGARRGIAATIAVAVVLGLGIVIGAAIEDGSRAGGSVATVAPSAVDIGFSQDMIVHHEQAVAMAQLVRDRTRNPRIAALAAGIESGQLLDIGAMRGYLALWQAPGLPSGPPMTWMAAGQQHHSAGEEAMPGMATVAELNALREAQGNAMDRMFLKLMLRHHQGGLAMLDDAAANAAVPVIRSLAARISFHQKEETQTINALLAQLGR